jgi:hypothetical protein
MKSQRRAAAVAAALFTSVAAAGCSSTALSEQDLLNQPRIVNDARPGAPAAPVREPASPAEANAAVATAEDQLEAGDPAAALETVRRALERFPPREQGDRLREIRTLAKKAFLRSAIARGAASAPERAAEGGVLDVRVALRNLSPVPLSVPAPAAGTSPTLVRLRATRTAWDIYGNVRAETWEETHPLPPGEAGPGGALEAVLTVDTARFRDTLPHGFVRYEFGGSILPSGVAVGDTAVHDRIPVDPAVTLTFPQRGWEDVAAEPVLHLDRGLRAGNPVRLLVAAACLAPAERPAAAARLARILRDGAGPGVENAVRAALRYLGEDPGADLWTVAQWEARAAAGPAEEER